MSRSSVKAVQIKSSFMRGILKNELLFFKNRYEDAIITIPGRLGKCDPHVGYYHPRNRFTNFF
jgi:hypothetical protein